MCLDVVVARNVACRVGELILSFVHSSGKRKFSFAYLRPCRSYSSASRGCTKWRAVTKSLTHSAHLQHLWYLPSTLKMPSVLMVAEKPSICNSIADVLSGKSSQFEKRGSIPVHRFNGTFQGAQRTWSSAAQSVLYPRSFRYLFSVARKTSQAAARRSLSLP